MPSSVVEEGFLLFIFHKLVNQIHDVDFKLPRSVWIGFSVIPDSLNQFFLFVCVLHNLLYFDNAKVIIFCVLHKCLSEKIIFWILKTSKSLLMVAFYLLGPAAKMAQTFLRRAARA